MFLAWNFWKQNTRSRLAAWLKNTHLNTWHCETSPFFHQYFLCPAPVDFAANQNKKNRATRAHKNTRAESRAKIIKTSIKITQNATIAVIDEMLGFKNLALLHLSAERARTIYIPLYLYGWGDCSWLEGCEERFIIGNSSNKSDWLANWHWSHGATRLDTPPRIQRDVKPPATIWLRRKTSSAAKLPWAHLLTFSTTLLRGAFRMYAKCLSINAVEGFHFQFPRRTIEDWRQFENKVLMKIFQPAGNRYRFWVC